MSTQKCAFSHTLLDASFGCQRVTHVTQRDGPQVVCTHSQSAQRCQQLFEACKQAALPVFDVPDDLASMPHSVPVKIQFGALLGLQAFMQGDSSRVADIDALLSAAEQRCGGLNNIPCSEFVDHMTGFKIKRRSGR